jgi:malonate transporter
VRYEGRKTHVSPRLALPSPLRANIRALYAMTALFSLVLPIFALIGVGWLARRLELLGPHSAHEINRFVIFLGRPALLFQITAKSTWGEHDLLGFTAAFGLGCGLIFATTVIARRVQGFALADASLDALSAGFANVGCIGFPLCVAAFGPSSLTPATITSILTLCVLHESAIVVVETGLRRGGNLTAITGKVAISLAKSPLLLPAVAGVIYAALAPPLPDGLNRFLTLLSSTAAPCALVSVGIFIAGTRSCLKWPRLAPLVALKLAGQPALTWLSARYAFHLQPTMTGIAVVLAALPTGTGPLLLANLYQRDATVSVGSILISTVASLATISLLLTVIIK